MEITNVELQNIPSDIEGLHLVAVLGHSPDGWRCYEAAVVMPSMLDPNFETKWKPAVERASQYAAANGNKLSPENARRYFHFPKAIADNFAP